MLGPPVLVLVLAILSSALAIWQLEPRPVTAVLAPVMDPPAKVFRVSNFVAVPCESREEGHPVSYFFSLPLPRRFELRVEILASAKAVREIRLAGLPLGHRSGSVTKTGDVKAQDAVPANHSVSLRRNGKCMELCLDGWDILLGPSERLSDRLCIESAPDETAILKNLIVTWQASRHGELPFWRT